MEPLRPLLDHRMLGWMRGVRWRRSDFRVTVEGVVRLHEDLAKVVVQRAVLPDKNVQGEVDWYVGVLGATLEGSRFGAANINL